MNYNIDILDTESRFIKITAHIPYIRQNNVKVQLPAWRPGRYELANYAKNIRNFEVFDVEGNPLNFEKITKDCWDINVSGLKEFVIIYEYYANQYDAGASYVSEEQLYINPVNCLMYMVGKEDEPFTVTLNVPKNYKIACQLPIKGKTLFAKNFDQLADSPFIASDKLEQHSINFEESNLHFWFMGKNPFNATYMQKLKEDTLAYTQAQTKVFGEFPCKDYHFLYHILNVPFRHGVEHEDSTVISMGVTADTFMPEFYDDLLAISSHELFHLWNVKRLRPVEMWPYDFTKENYSRLGYVYEGVPPYCGDLMLLRSGVWEFDKYAESLSGDFDKHFNNEGRYNYSVAESSFDTWLDGYVPGIAARKVSIYTEGCIAALIADVLILKHSNGKHRLDDVLKKLYQECYLQNRGYTQKDYQETLEEFAGISFDEYFLNLINGSGNWDKYIVMALDTIGCSLILNKLKNGSFKTKVVLLDNQNKNQQKMFKLWCV